MRTRLQIVMMTLLVAELAACVVQSPVGVGGSETQSDETPRRTPKPLVTQAQRTPGASPAQTPTPTGATAPAASPVSALLSPTPSQTAIASPPIPPVPSATPTPEPVAMPSYVPGGPEVVSAARNIAGDTRISGSVRDEAGALVAGDGTVAVFFQDFTYRADVVNGQYDLKDLPPRDGIALVQVSKPGFTARIRNVHLKGGYAHTVNFGGTEAFEAPYFISDYPEIVSVEPVHGKTNISHEQVVRLAITLSEPLDSQNRDAFIKALTITPANQTATGNNVVPALLNGTRLAEVDLKTFPYSIWWDPLKAGETPGVDTPVWVDDTRLTCAKTLSALTGSKIGGEYQVGLVWSDEYAVKDPSGKQLGTSLSGAFGTHPGEDGFMSNVFQALPVGGQGFAGATPTARWQSTHRHASNYQLTTDTLPPKPLAFRCAVLPAPISATVFEFEFDSDLVVFGPDDRGPLEKDTLTWHPNVDDLDRYTFAIGRSQNDLKDLTLDGKTNVINVPSDRIGFGSNPNEIGKEFRIVGTQACPVVVSFKPNDSSGIRVVTINNNAQFFSDPSVAVAIKGRAGGVTDPAGNRMTDEEANAANNQKIIDILYVAGDPAPSAYRLQRKRRAQTRRP